MQKFQELKNKAFIRKQNFEEIKSLIEEKENIEIFKEQTDLNQQNLIKEEEEII